MDEAPARAAEIAEQPAVIERLIEQLREKKKYHHLFEALKLRLRHRMGLSLWEHTPGDQLDPKLRNQYEDGLVEACREVGRLLLAQGKFREAWMYLRPAGERAEVSKALTEATPTEETTTSMMLRPAWCGCAHAAATSPPGPATRSVLTDA